MRDRSAFAPKFAPKFAAIAAIIAPLIAGCAAGAPGSDAYRAGHRDGCVSGYAEAGRAGYHLEYLRDAERFAAEADYRTGWQEAYRACFDDETRMPYLAPMI